MSKHPSYPVYIQLTFSILFITISFSRFLATIKDLTADYNQFKASTIFKKC